ncbi:unnamed protein product [Symbiodinium sp. CCMP2592]|nr:unnamed protein product [Symbiodinium sp. CCMP2592]
MSKKAGTPAYAPVYVESKLLKLDDVSVAHDSGHRDVDEDRVLELYEKVILAGRWGQASLSRPKLRYDPAGRPMAASDGRSKLADGKHCIAALKKAAETVAQSDDATQLEWYTGEIKDILTVGMRFDCIKFSDDDEAAVKLFYTMAHEQEANKLRTTSVEHKIKLVRAYVAKDAENAMVEILGKSRRSTIHNWCKATAVLKEPVLIKLKEKPDLPQGLVFTNKYFVGQGEETRFLLEPEQQIAALQLFYDFCDGRGTVSSIPTFMSDFCAPMLKAQLWCQLVMKKYSSVVSRLPAYDRCQKMLWSERGRTCMRLGVGLSGDPKIEGSGIPECVSVLQGLKNLAAGRAVDEAESAVDAAKATVTEHKLVVEGGDDESGILADDITMEAPLVEKDPVLEKAEELGLSVRSNIHLFHDMKTFGDGFVGLCRATTRGGIYIDEATSKAKIILGDMAELWKVVTSVVDRQYVSMGIFCGKRHDLVTLVVTGTVDPPLKRLRVKTFLKNLDQSRSRWKQMSKKEKQPFVDAAVKDHRKHNALKRELAHPPVEVDSPVRDPKPENDSDQQPPVDENLVNELRFSFEGMALSSRSTLGQGAHGTVYRCENLMGTEFAVKLPVGSRDVKRELDVLLSLRHPAILHCYGPVMSVDGGLVGLLLEYVPVTLDAWLKTQPKAAKCPHKWHLMVDLAHGLQYLHCHKLVHCDVKPQNILVGPAPHVRARWADFGLTEPVGTAVYGDEVYSAAYRPPELSGSQEPGRSFAVRVRLAPTADLWAVGCLLFAIFTTSTLCHLFVTVKVLYDMSFINSRIDKNVPVVSGAQEDIRAFLKKLPNERQQLRLFIIAAEAYVITFTAGPEQSRNRRPTYMVYSQSELSVSAKEVVPSHVTVNKCRSFAYEKLQMRCTDYNCKLRPCKPMTDMPAHPTEELPVSDQEQPEDSKTLDTTEEAGPDTQAVEASVDKKYPVDLWLVAKCWDHHASVVREVFRGDQCRWMAVSTRTAHPSIFVGVQSVVSTVIGMHVKLRHSMAHGRVLLDDMCTALKLDEASRSLNLKRKVTDIPCVPVFNPYAAEGSVFKLLEIPVESTWRNGINKSVANYNDMEKKCNDLTHEELVKYDLGLSVIDGHVALITTVPKKEGDLICTCSALHFDNMASLLSVVNSDKVNLAKNPVLRTDCVGLTEDRSSSVWSLLIGAASHVAPLSKAAKRANAAFNFDISQGASDGLIALVVKTRNGCGIAAKSVVSVDLGPDYDPSQATPVELAASKKQFMDKWFQAKAKPSPVAPAPVTPAPATGPVPVDKPAPSAAAETSPPVVKADVTAPEPELNPASVANFIVGDATFRLDLQNLRILLPVGTSTNKRLPPGTIVYTLDCSAGRFRKNSSAVGLEYKLTSSKDKVIVNGKQVTVADAVASLKSNSVWEHIPPSFTQGSLPSAGLKPNQQMVWVPGDDASVVMAQLNKATDASWRWVMKNGSKGSLTPVKACLVIDKQLIIPGKPGHLGLLVGREVGH